MHFNGKYFVAGLAIVFLGGGIPLAYSKYYSYQDKYWSAELNCSWSDARKYNQIFERGDKDDSLGESDWAELEKAKLSPNVKLRMNLPYLLGGISARKSPQRRRVVDFLASLTQDQSGLVRANALSVLRLYDEQEAKKQASLLIHDQDGAVERVVKEVLSSS